MQNFTFLNHEKKKRKIRCFQQYSVMIKGPREEFVRTSYIVMDLTGTDNCGAHYFLYCDK